METAKRITILLAVVFLTIAAAQPSEKPAETKMPAGISYTRSASCIVRISCDPAVLPLNFRIIRELIYSSGVAGRAARDVLGLPPDAASALFRVNELSATQGVSMPLSPIGQPTPVGPGFGSHSSFEPARPFVSPEGLPEPEQSAEEETITPATPGTPPAAPGMLVPTTVVPTPPRGGYGRIEGYGGGGYGGGGYGGYGYGGGGYGGGYGFNVVPSGLPLANPEQPVIAAEQTLLFGLVVNFDTPWPVQKPTVEARPAAEEFMRALVAYLQENLIRVWGEQRMRLDSQEKTAQEEAVRSQQILEDYQQQLRALAGSRNLSRTEILSRCDSLRNKLEATQMDAATDELMLKSISEQIAQTQEKMAAQIKEDSVTTELERILQIQKELYAEVREHQGRAEVADALEKVTRARIELAQRREQLSKTAGGDKINSLNNRVADLSLRITQADAQRKRFDQQLTEAEELLTKADTYELLSLKADLERQNLQQALVWRDAISRQIRLLQEPLVSVLGGQ